MIRHSYRRAGVVVCDLVELAPVGIPTTTIVPKAAVNHRGRLEKTADDQVEEVLELRPGDCFCRSCGRVYHQWTKTEELLNDARAQRDGLVDQVYRAQRRIPSTLEAESFGLMADAIEGLRDEVLKQDAGEMEAVLD